MKKGFMLFTLLAAFSGFAQADDAAIQQTLAKMGIKSSDIQPAPVAGMKTVLTNSGVLYITDDGKHIIQGPMYDVSFLRQSFRQFPHPFGTVPLGFLPQTCDVDDFHGNTSHFVNS